MRRGLVRFPRTETGHALRHASSSPHVLHEHLHPHRPGLDSFGGGGVGGVWEMVRERTEAGLRDAVEAVMGEARSDKSGRKNQGVADSDPPSP